MSWGGDFVYLPPGASRGGQDQEGAGEEDAGVGGVRSGAVHLESSLGCILHGFGRSER